MPPQNDRANAELANIIRFQFKSSRATRRGPVLYRVFRPKFHSGTASGDTPREAYNPVMARGWESKAVELQQEEAGTVQQTRRALSQEQRILESQKHGLELSRSRILQQMHPGTDPRYRKILEQALADLEQQLKKLG